MVEYRIEQVLAHEAPMILIDKLLAYDTSSGICEVTINEQSVFYDSGRKGVPSYIGIEYMAQAIAAFAGANDLDAGRNKHVGFLLGSRKLSTNVATFYNRQKLKIKVLRLFQEPSGLGVFDCAIFDGEHCLAEANVNVYQPGGTNVYE